MKAPERKTFNPCLWKLSNKTRTNYYKETSILANIPKQLPNRDTSHRYKLIEHLFDLIYYNMMSIDFLRRFKNKKKDKHLMSMIELQCEKNPLQKVSPV